MLQNFGNSHKYTDEEKRRFNLWSFHSQVDNPFKLSEKLDYTTYLQRHLWKLKCEIERQASLLDKNTQSK